MRAAEATLKGIGSACQSATRLRDRLDGVEVERADRSKLGRCMRYHGSPTAKSF